MTTKNILDLTGYKVASQLAAFVSAGVPFVVQVLHPEGYLVNAFTARLEQAKRKQVMRWYGYKRIASKLHKVYLGRGEDLTIERLQRAADELALRVPDARV